MDAGSLFGLLLIGLTAGTVTYLFLLILVLGHRHRTAVERLLFLVFLAMFLHQSGLLLYLNTLLVPLEHGGAAKFALSFAYLGLLFLPALLVNLHVQYLKLLRGRMGFGWTALAVAFYTPAPYWLWIGFGNIWRTGRPNSATDFGPHVLLTASFATVALIHWLAARSQTGPSRILHVTLCAFFAVACTVLALLTATGRFDWRNDPLAALLIISPAVPGAITAYFVLRRSFGQLEVQRNLVFAAAGGFLAVLYLTLTSRASMWLAPYFPPVATISILVFVLVFLFEPLQRWLSRALRRLFRVEVERVQRLMTEIHGSARGGNLEELLRFSGRRIAQEFQFAAVAISLDGNPRLLPAKVFVFPLEAEGARERLREEAAPVLLVSHAGAILSGETQATLETLARQLPAAIGLCRAIEEKLRLERELAERERFAMLGQMAASITHNLKNPLGSMKTLLQLQLENPNAPEEIRRDCEMVVGEIDRMSAKLQQLLHYGRPAVRPGLQAAPVDAAAVTARLLDLLRKDAAQRGIALLLEKPPGDLPVTAPEDALSDIFQNLIVNAVEASTRRGTVKVSLARHDSGITFSVSDEGPGIPPEVQARIFQPFFTTKPAGTGLGLAIVQRRLHEIGGTIACHSPIAVERGTRFVVVFPA